MVVLALTVNAIKQITVVARLVIVIHFVILLSAKQTVAVYA